MAKHTLEGIKKDFPVGKSVVIDVNRGANRRSIKAEVTGHRQTGVYLFIDTRDGDKIERSVRPGSLKAA